MEWVSRMAANLGPELEEMQAHLGAHPERSWQEVQTTAYINRKLQALERDMGVSLDLTTFGDRDDGGPPVGVRGRIRVGTHRPTVLLSADIDALPLEDKRDSGLWVISKNPGTHHACGHNMHTAALFGGTKLLLEAARRGELRYNVDLLWAPAEEHGNAMKWLIRKHGILNGVDAAYGIHGWPRLRVGEIGVRDGAIQRGWHKVEFLLEAQGGHTGRLQETGRVHSRASQFEQAFPRELAIGYRWDEIPEVGLAMIRTESEAGNVVGEWARLEGTIRSATMKTYLNVPADVDRVVRQLEGSFWPPVKITTTLLEGIPPMVNTDFAHVTEVAGKYFTPQQIVTMQQLGGADPFAEASQGLAARGEYPAVTGAKASVYWQVGVASPDPAVPTDSHPDLHTPAFFVHPGAAEKGAIVYAMSALDGIPPAIAAEYGMRAKRARRGGVRSSVVARGEGYRGQLHPHDPVNRKLGH